MLNPRMLTLVVLAFGLLAETQPALGQQTTGPKLSMP